MGWSGGAVIFDTVAQDLLEIYAKPTSGLFNNEVINILTNLLLVLEDQDWDNLGESEYWNHEVIGSILGNTFEDEDE